MLHMNGIWQDTLARLSGSLSSVAYSIWVEPLRPLCIKNNTLVLISPTQNAKATVMQNHKDIIKNCVSAVTPYINDVSIITESEADGFSTELSEEATGGKTFIRVSPFTARYTFENFVVGDSNNLVFHAAKAVAQRPGSTDGYLNPNPLFIYGGSGLGKTHILHSIGNYIFENTPSLNILYVSAENLMNDYVEALSASTASKKNMKEFRQKYRSVDVLMIDDVQFLKKSVGLQEALFHIFNDLYQAGKQIIMSSDRPPKEISTLEDRLRSRFEGGLLADISLPNLELRIAIIRKKIQLEKLNIPDEIIQFVAEKYETNIREMEGALSRIVFYSHLVNKPLTIEIAKLALKTQEPSQNNDTVTASDIINATSTYFNISKQDILSKKKNKEIVEARMYGIFLVWDVLNLPLVEIGQLFGGRDHSTVINSRNRIQEQKESNKETVRKLRDIMDMLRTSQDFPH